MSQFPIQEKTMDIDMELREWVKGLPSSRVAHPERFPDYLKYFFWKVYTPFHPLVRNMFVLFGFRKMLRVAKVITFEGRQDFLFGTLLSTVSAKEFVSFLVNEGYGNHFVAWKDKGQLASLRRTDGFTHQYHVRVFMDGEVRCHYEYTPEYRPFSHLKATDQEERKEYFTNLLREWVALA